VGEEVAFVGVNLRDEQEAAEAMAERTGVSYDLVIDRDGELARELDVVNLPVTMLVLPDGTIATTSGEDGGACAGSGVRDRYGLDDADGNGSSAAAGSSTPATGAEPASAGGG